MVPMMVGVADRFAASRWLCSLLARQFLRFCPVRDRVEICEGCHLRALCKCAQEDILAASAGERRFWFALAVSGAVAILLALFALLRSN